MNYHVKEIRLFQKYSLKMSQRKMPQLLILREQSYRYKFISTCFHIIVTQTEQQVYTFTSQYFKLYNKSALSVLERWLTGKEYTLLFQRT